MANLIPAPDDSNVRSILARHGFPADLPMDYVPLEGSVNHTRLCGAVCIKLLKDWENVSDVYCELVATPAVRKIGALVPELLAFDESSDLHPGPVVLWERGEGEALGNLTEVEDLQRVYVELTEQARLWHEQLREIDDPNSWLDDPEPGDPTESFALSLDRMEASTRAWCERTFTRLSEAKPGPDAFGNWDLHAHNVLIKNHRLSMILDWGDAGFGDPILNFTSFPAEFLPRVVEAFGVPDPDFVGRLIREVLCYALNAYNTPDWPNLRHKGMKRWRSFERLYDQNLPDPWKHWLGDPPPCDNRSEH